MADFTPMMKQYFEIKREHSDYILFYRLGDFYEMFFDDAKIASKELELVLTGKDCGQDERAPMCGVPYHSCEAYIQRLIAKGYKVAICEQTEDPSKAKGLVKREVVRMITPGTVIESSMLEDGKNNYICSVFMNADGAGICFCDISTGEADATFIIEKKADEMARKVSEEFSRYQPREAVLFSNAAKSDIILSFLKDRISCNIEDGGESAPGIKKAMDIVIKQFVSTDITAPCFIGKDNMIIAAAGLFEYLYKTQKTDLSYLHVLNYYSQSQYLQLDFNAKRNLELTQTLRQKDKKGSLLWVLDHTNTSMGARLLKSFIDKPLMDISEIKRRQNCVADLIHAVIERNEIAKLLCSVLDIERLISRIVYKSASCKDLRALAQTAAQLPEIKRYLSAINSARLRELSSGIDELSDIWELIERAIVDEPPFTVREGGMIKKGYDENIDSLKELATGGRSMITDVETRERERTGIKNLKIGYNKVFGYYIEVTKSYLDQVPEDYIRKQTLFNCERYITQELKNLEDSVLSANEKLCALEYEVFCRIRDEVSGQTLRIQKTAAAIAHLDVLISFAETASKNNYVMPEIDCFNKIVIKDGRHPVVEKMLKDSMFVPNDALLDIGDNRALIITGPNMAGKSTYMRQIALIVIMAHMGSFVPAKYAQIGICDRVFTRIGASDDLSGGQSTFMVEMSEVADILKNATSKSLIILDEVGRGTSTFDGMSMARAVLEYIADKKKIGAKTLFATHYHELTDLEGLVEGIVNYNIAVKKRGDDIIFLRKIVRGKSDDSYGIEVAKLAGVPSKVTDRAKEILAVLEDENQTGERQRPPLENAAADDTQVSLADMHYEEIIDSLKGINAETLTPIEALNILYGIQKKIREY